CLDKRIVKEGITTVTTDNKESTALFSDNYDNSEVTIPLLKSQDQQYTIDVIYHNGKKYSEAAPYNFKATVNSDNTYTIENSNQYTDPTTGKVVNADAKFDKDTDALQTTFIQMTENGSISSSYTENSLTIDGQHIIYRTTPQGNKEANSARSKELEEDDVAGVPNVDWVYQKLDQKKDEIMVVDAGDQAQDILYLNADTGEVLMSQALKDRLASLKTVLNANTIDVVYDKKEWTEGDIQPQHLFKCTYVGSDGSDDTIKEMDGKIREHDVLYNGGFRGHDIQYDVGYNQRITVNTTADTVFTANVKRDVDDLSNIMDQLNQVNTVINTLKEKLASTTDPDDKNTIQNEINAAQKAYDYLRTDLQKEFEHKITSMSEALDAANVAVTQNGTRSRRLELIQTRLQNQQTTFKVLQSNNEDADIAETATGLTTAQTTYQASLIATGKISQTSLMDYI
ncbi:MAG: hypothetical protein IJT34_07595, partial [Butyrivibrio sp.]|nr:hypothetical protein [Butyrivibrio sp.]